jgi:methylmalonyl-CoA/ethylmalonyl-CoA epimerase
VNKLGLSFHHIGLAVSQVKPAIAFLSELGYEVGPIVSDPLQGVQLIMCLHATAPAVEIISPSPDHKGPVNELTKKNPSGIVYHTCYETTDLTASLDHAKSLGLSVYCISEPKPAVLFGGRKVSFYRIGGMGLVEILEPSDQGSAEAGSV